MRGAAEIDPTNYLSLFKRATVYLGQGRTKSAISDLDRVIARRPDFLQARLKRGELHMHAFAVDKARADFDAVLAADPSSTDASRSLATLRQLEAHMDAGSAALRHGDYAACLQHLTAVIESAPLYGLARQKRAQCYRAVGDIDNAVADLTRASKMGADLRSVSLELSQIEYDRGDMDEALRWIRECLKLDQDDAKCKPIYLKLKKLSKTIEAALAAERQKRYAAALDEWSAALRLEGRVAKFAGMFHQHTCHIHVLQKKPAEAIAACRKAVDLNDEDVQALQDMAEAYVMQDQVDEGALCA